MTDNKGSSRLIQEQVFRYLEQNPDFLTKHPQLLESLVIKHPSGEASSLIEHQVKRLQQKNRELSLHLKQLIQVASENEQLMSRLHNVTLRLLSISDLSAFLKQLLVELDQQFNADQIFIGLFGDLPELSPGLPVHSLDHKDAELQQFSSFLDKGATACGRLSKSKLAYLFDDHADTIQSTALVPLGNNAEYGMLAIGSGDASRFYPGMGTLFLELLGDVIGHRLATSDIEPRRRTA